MWIPAVLSPVVTRLTEKAHETNFRQSTKSITINNASKLDYFITSHRVLNPIGNVLAAHYIESRDFYNNNNVDEENEGFENTSRLTDSGETLNNTHLQNVMESDNLVENVSEMINTTYHNTRKKEKLEETVHKVPAEAQTEISLDTSKSFASIIALLEKLTDGLILNNDATLTKTMESIPIIDERNFTVPDNNNNINIKCLKTLQSPEILPSSVSNNVQENFTMLDQNNEVNIKCSKILPSSKINSVHGNLVQIEEKKIDIEVNDNIKTSFNEAFNLFHEDKTSSTSYKKVTFPYHSNIGRKNIVINNEKPDNLFTERLDNFHDVQHNLTANVSLNTANRNEFLDTKNKTDSTIKDETQKKPVKDNVKLANSLSKKLLCTQGRKKSITSSDKVDDDFSSYQKNILQTCSPVKTYVQSHISEPKQSLTVKLNPTTNESSTDGEKYQNLSNRNIDNINDVVLSNNKNNEQVSSTIIKIEELEKSCSEDLGTNFGLKHSYFDTAQSLSSLKCTDVSIVDSENTDSQNNILVKNEGMKYENDRLDNFFNINPRPVEVFNILGVGNYRNTPQISAEKINIESSLQTDKDEELMQSYTKESGAILSPIEAENVITTNYYNDKLTLSPQQRTDSVYTKYIRNNTMSNTLLNFEEELKPIKEDIEKLKCSVIDLKISLNKYKNKILRNNDSFTQPVLYEQNLTFKTGNPNYPFTSIKTTFMHQFEEISVAKIETNKTNTQTNYVSYDDKINHTCREKQWNRQMLYDDDINHTCREKQCNRQTMYDDDINHICREKQWNRQMEALDSLELYKLERETSSTAGVGYSNRRSTTRKRSASCQTKLNHHEDTKGVLKNISEHYLVVNQAKDSGLMLNSTPVKLQSNTDDLNYKNFVK